MLIRNRKMFIKLSMLVMLAISLNSNASTICSFNCPGTGGGPEEPLPQILEIYSTDGSGLTLDTNGLIILDINLFNNLSDLTINSPTPIYQGLSELPSVFALPEELQLNTISYTGEASFVGLENDILIRQYDIGAILNLTATNGVLVMDTNSLFAVPLPGAIWFLLSGLFSMVALGVRKK